MGNSLNRLGALGLAALTTTEPALAGEPVQNTANSFFTDGGDLRAVSQELMDQTHFVIQDTGACGSYDDMKRSKKVGYELVSVGAQYCPFYPVAFVGETPDHNFVFREVYQDPDHPEQDPIDCYQGRFYSGTLQRSNPLNGELQTVVILPSDQKRDGGLITLDECPVVTLAPVASLAPVAPAAPITLEKPVKAPKEPRESHPFHFPTIAPKLAFEGSAWIGMGEESIGNPYALGFTGEGDQTPRPALGVDLEWMPMGTDRGLRVGATADTVFSVAGSGFDRVGGTVGWKQGVASLDAHAGVSGEPADVGDTALDGVPYAALEFSYERPMPKLPGGFVISLEGGVDMFRAPVDPSDAYAMLSVGWQGDLEINRSERTHEPKLAPVVPPLVVEAGPTVLKFDVSYVARSSGITLPPANEVLTDVQKGEVARLSEEMKKLEQVNKHAAVLTDYKQLLDLNLPLPRNAYFLAYQAARSLGDMETARQALALAMNVQLTSVEQTNSSLGDASLDVALQDIIQHYGYVHLVLQKSVKRPASAEDCVTLLGLTSPFSPDERAVFATAVQSLMSTGEYEGYFPVDAASGFAVVPYATEERIQVFSAHR